MNHPDSPLSPSSSPSPDSLPPPPREVTPNFRAMGMRAGFLAGMLLGPLLALWIGQMGAENLRTLAARGRTTTGQFAVWG